MHARKVLFIVFFCEVCVVWTSLGPLPRWVPGPTTRWAPRTTDLRCTTPHGVKHKDYRGEVLG
jgi:hypothetical protein